MNYYEHHLGDWAAATGHLSWDEDMAYTRLLRTYLHARRERMPGWVTRQQIVVAVGRHHKAVDWALTFLRAVRLVEASQDARCSRYLRYRAIKGGGAD